MVAHASRNMPESLINNQAGFGFANAYPSNAPGSRCI